MELYHETSAWHHVLERYWLLIPLGLIFVMAVAGFETYLLNASTDLPLQDETDITLPGSPTRFDYQSLDPQARLLYIAHSGANAVIVFNIASRTVVKNIAGINHVHGILAVPELKRVYATDSDDNLVYVISEQTQSVITTIPLDSGDGPDGLAYDPATFEVYVSSETGHNDAVINTRTDTLVAEIPLGGEAGNTQYDLVSHHIFVDVQTLDRLVEINPETRRVVASYPVPGCDHDHGLNIDSPQRLAFISCDGNNMLYVMDMLSMKVVAQQSVGASPDVLALDGRRHYLYVASESGVVSVFDEEGRTLQKEGEGYVADEAHSIAVDQQSHDVFLPLQNVNNNPVLRIALFSQTS
jgi:YVTN family beta-propeller protein